MGSVKGHSQAKVNGSPLLNGFSIDLEESWSFMNHSGGFDFDHPPGLTVAESGELPQGQNTATGNSILRYRRIVAIHTDPTNFLPGGFLLDACRIVESC